MTMQFPQMSLLLLGAGILQSFPGATSSVIPTKEEQANLLTNVEEVFEQLKVLVNVEGNSTDQAVVSDINRMIGRAKDKLSLVKELALTKMSCRSNSVCMLDTKPVVERLAREGADSLKHCVVKGSSEVTVNSNQTTNATESATGRGQRLLDSLWECSRKPGLQVVNCYKQIIATDVVPVKTTLLEAIEAHKLGHLQTIQIRKEANDCVDSIMNRYELKIAKVLDQALNCH